jgi:hypothetical protein
MTNIIDLDHERAGRKREITVMLYERIQQLCEGFWNEDHDSVAVIRALLRAAASIVEAEGGDAEWFLGFADDVADLFWPLEEECNGEANQPPAPRG